MYFEELIKSAYIKSDPPDSDEIILLLAGCKDHIDKNMVISVADFEAILMNNRAKDPASEAVLMAIGRASKNPSDPVWDIMLQRESVVDRFAQLCNMEAERVLSELESSSSVDTFQSTGIFDPVEPDTVVPEDSKEENKTVENQESGEPAFAWSISVPSVEMSIPDTEKDIVSQESESEPEPVSFMPPPPWSQPVLEPDSPVIPQASSTIGMFGIPIGKDGMGAYIDRIEKHKPYNADVESEDTVEEVAESTLGHKSGIDFDGVKDGNESRDDSVSFDPGIIPEGIAASEFSIAPEDKETPEMPIFGVSDTDTVYDGASDTVIAQKEDIPEYTPYPIQEDMSASGESQVDAFDPPVEEVEDEDKDNSNPVASSYDVLGDKDISPAVFPESIPKTEQYDVPGYIPPSQVSVMGGEAGPMNMPDLDRLAAMQSTFADSQQDDQEEAIETVEELESQENKVDEELLCNVRNIFDTFHGLVREYTLEVILNSEGLTAEKFCEQLVTEFPMFSQQYNTSMQTFSQNYSQVACGLVQSLQLEAENAVYSGDLGRAERCIAPVCRLIYEGSGT